MESEAREFKVEQVKLQDTDSILKLDQQIKDMYNLEKLKLPEYIQTYTYIQNVLDKSECLTHNEREQLGKQAKDLNQKIFDLSSDMSYGFYLMESYLILEECHDLSQQVREISFMGKKKSDKPRSCYVRKFAQILKPLKNVININYVYDSDTDSDIESKKKTECPVCMKKITTQYDDVSRICECGFQEDTHFKKNIYKDSEKSVMKDKNPDDTQKTHFKDCMKQHQGTQKVSIEPEVYEKLEKQFQSHNLLGPEYLPRKERFNQITKNHVHTFLRRTNQSKHYENETLIWSNLTEKPGPDISHLEDKLLDDYDALMAVYHKMDKKGRTNALNSQYILYQLLRKHKYKCDQSDFNIIKTDDRREYHNNMCRKIFNQLGWNFIPI